jgi:predicted nucleic acid-binding protein
VAGALYLDTSVVLKAVLEGGTTPEIEEHIRSADVLLTSRLSLVEAARALLRLRQSGEVAEERLADVGREIEALWSRCYVWELTSSVCDLAAQVVPLRPLRALDVLHLATYLLARRRIDDLSLLTTDARLEAAARSA